MKCIIVRKSVNMTNSCVFHSFGEISYLDTNEVL